MKKIIGITSILILLSMISVKAQEMSLEEILQNYYEVNNLKKLSGMNSIYAEGKVITQGMEMPFIQKIKRGGKVKNEVEVQNNKMIQAYNGETGWMIAPWLGTDEPQDMNEDQIDQLKEQGEFEGKLWNWKEKVESLELIGKEEMEGTEVYTLKMIEKPELDETEEDAEGEAVEDEEKPKNIRYFYIDAENFVVLKVKLKRLIQGNEMEIENFTSNFKEVDEIIMPFNIETRIDGKTVTQIIIERIEFNVEMEDSEFERPGEEE